MRRRRYAVQAVVVVGIATSWSGAWAWDLTVGAGPIQGYQYGQEQVIAGVRVRESFRGTTLSYASAGYSMSDRWATVLGVQMMRFATSTAVDDGRGAILHDRFSSRVMLLALTARREWKGINSWRINMEFGPGVALLRWNEDVWRGETKLGGYKRDDAVPGVVGVFSLRRAIGRTWFLEVGGELLASADLKSKAMGPVERDFRGLRQGAVRVGVGIQSF